MTRINSQDSKATLTPALLMLMTVATGISVASNYYAQPLLNTISHSLSLSQTVAGSIVTAAQLFYALGLMLLVPLGDIIERRKLIVVMMILATLGLVISGSANSFIQLIIGTALSGFFVVVVQVLVPFAATLSAPAYRGRAVGVVMSGLLMGILLARTFAGFISSIGGWRSVYWVAAVLMTFMTIALATRLPKYPPVVKIAYPALIKSIFVLFKDYPPLRLRAILGGLDFALFSILWTPLAFMLVESYHYSDMVIGLFGLAGAAGAMVAPYAGKFADQGKSGIWTTIGLALLLFSWIPLYFGTVSIVALIIGILVLDMAVQLVHIINMNEVFKLNPEARNRLNANYMFAYFIGGTVSSLSSAYVYQHYGWTGVCVFGAVVALVSMALWFIGKKTVHQTI